MNQSQLDISSYQNCSQYHVDSTFSFTGKERDKETGYSYFGARCYDADLLTGWMSVDPMADKYSSLSPYNYCTWDPVKLVDPDGEEVKYSKFSDRCFVATERLFRRGFRIRYNDLKKSSITYVFRNYNNSDCNGGEVTTDGEKIFINYNMVTKKDLGTNVLTNLRHETEHAIQFEYGEFGFDKGTNATWDNSAINFDINDEIKARDFGYSLGPLGLCNSLSHERTFRDDWLNSKIPKENRTYTNDISSESRSY